MSVNQISSTTLLKQKRKHPDRVTLLPIHLEILDRLIVKITNQHRGMVISRNDMLQWVLENRSSEFTTEENEMLKSKFQNEIYFLKHVMEELKRRKSTGQKVTALEIITELQS